MAKILVHLTHGPEHPTRAALAFLVAKAAIEEGHTVTLFLAGDVGSVLLPNIAFLMGTSAIFLTLLARATPRRLDG